MINFCNAQLLRKVLTPYKTDCRYLQQAHVELQQFTYQKDKLQARGQFSIPDSCYIDATGHFNSVEFNICYNQLMYYLLAECVQCNLLTQLKDWKMENFFRRQLSDFLIVNFKSSFHKKINSSSFDGYVKIKKVSIAKGENIFIQTECEFKDIQGGLAKGDILLAIVDTCSRNGGKI